MAKPASLARLLAWTVTAISFFLFLPASSLASPNVAPLAPVRAASGPAAAESPESVIDADILAQNDHNWTAYLLLRSSKLQAPENVQDWNALRTKHPENDFMQDIVSAQRVGTKALPLQVAASLTRLGEYLALYGDVRAYYVGVNYQLGKESRAFFNGVNYRLYILAPEEGRWVIVEASEAPVHRLIQAGFGFGTSEETTAESIQLERERTGRFFSPRGPLIETVTTTDHAQPNHITVFVGSSGQTSELDFYDYLIDVLPNEWVSTWPDAALQAGAVSAKMYGWYRVYYSKYPGEGYDVKDDTDDQVYQAGSAKASTTAAVNAVQGASYQQSDGGLFEPQYWDGKAIVIAPYDLRTAPGSSSKVQNGHVSTGAEVVLLSNGMTTTDGGGTYWWQVKTGSSWNWTSYVVGWIQESNLKSTLAYPLYVFRGRMGQWGSRYWADPNPSLNKSYDWIAHYFYDNSPNANDQPVTRFSYTPNRSPDQPDNTKPANAAGGVLLTPLLCGSAFSDPDTTDYHWKTWWQITRASDDGLVWDSGWRTYDLTSTMVPASLLGYSTAYKWQVRYMDSKGAWSEPPPDATQFTTMADPATMRSLYLPHLSQHQELSVPRSLTSSFLLYLPLVQYTIPPPPPQTCP